MYIILLPAASGCLCSCGFPFSLQAVETNLASKDSHWVFVNEVGAQKGEGVPHRASCPWGKLGMSFSRPVLTWVLLWIPGSTAPTQEVRDLPGPARMRWSGWEPGNASALESTGKRVSQRSCTRCSVWVRGLERLG